MWPGRKQQQPYIEGHQTEGKGWKVTAGGQSCSLSPSPAPGPDPPGPHPALSSAPTRLLHLHFHIGVREVVLWGQFAVIIDEVVQDGWAQDGLQKMDPEGEAVTARHALRVQANTAEDSSRAGHVANHELPAFLSQALLFPRAWSPKSPWCS